MFRAGDSVKHHPTGETWMLACDEFDGRVICLGWPETMAEANDCTIVKRATDEYRLNTLRRVKDSCRGQLRGSMAREQLEKLTTPNGAE